MYASLQTSKLTLATLFLAPCILLADGWSEVWPSQANPRQGYRHLSECYTAVVERCTATSNALPTAPAWYRSNRTILVERPWSLGVYFFCFGRPTRNQRRTIPM